jgi:threonine/homoserine/homoserine lactone efflux protein
MADAIGQSLSFAVGVALSPVPIIGIVLMLGTPRARANGPAFLLGWLLGIAFVGTAVLLLASGSDTGSQSDPSEGVSVLKLVLGVLLLLVAVRQWRGRPHGDEEPEMPAWMKTIDGFTAPKAAGFGVLLSSVNPKNLLLIVGGALAIAQSGASSGAEAGALAVFALVASIGTGTPLVLYFALGERSARILGEIKDWMSHNNAAIMAVICLIIGAKLIGDGISGLG